MRRRSPSPAHAPSPAAFPARFSPPPLRSGPTPYRGRLRDRLLQAVAQLAVAVGLVAWALTKTSSHAALNIPLAALLVLGVKWVADGTTAAARARALALRTASDASSLDTGASAPLGRSPSGVFGGGGLYAPPGGGGGGRPPLARSTGSVAASLAGFGVTAGPPATGGAPPQPPPPASTFTPLSQALRSGADASPAADAAWRAAVGEPAVIAAWEGFCGAIVQEFIYDAWWSSLTPDTHFPASVRAALNAAFGELAAAARGIDVRRVLLVDAVDLLSDHLQLFRESRAAAVAATPGGRAAWAALPPAARERALARELRASGNLHPALYPPGSAAAAGGAPVGHHAVLARIGDGLAACLLTRPDFNHPAVRPLIAELLAAAVLKPLVGLFAPHSIARMAMNALRGADARRREAAAAVAAAAAAAAAAEMAAAGGGGEEAPATDSGHIGSKPSVAEPKTSAPPPSVAAAAAAAAHHPTQGAWEFEARARRSAAAEAAARAGGVGGPGAPAPLKPDRGGPASPAPAWTRAGWEGGVAPVPASLARSASEQGLSSLLSRAGEAAAAKPADAAADALAPSSSRGLTPLRRRARGSKSSRAAAAAAAVAGAAGGEGGPAAPPATRTSSSNPSSPERRGSRRSLLLRPEGGGSEGSEATSAGPPAGLPPVGPSRLRRAGDSPSPPPGPRPASGGVLREGSPPVRGRSASPSSSEAAGGAAEPPAPPPPPPRPDLRLDAPAAPASDGGGSAGTPTFGGGGLPPVPRPPRPAATAARRPGGWTSYGGPGDGGGADPLDLEGLRAAAAAAAPGATTPPPPLLEEEDEGADGSATPPSGPAATATPTTPTAAAAAAAAALPALPTGWADRAPLPASATGPAAAGYFGFLGTPTASVVAAHVDTSGAKDVALFLVRVADGRGEWAVARRHRHFEAMHRALKEAVPGYRLRPPAKRSLLGGVSHAPEAVEERRRGLDAYLWKVLADPTLASRVEVWDFLSAWGRAPVPDGGSGLARAVSTVGNTLRGASTPLRRAAGAVAAGAAGAVGAVGGAVGELVDLVSGGGDDEKPSGGGSRGGATPGKAPKPGRQRGLSPAPPRSPPPPAVPARAVAAAPPGSDGEDSAASAAVARRSPGPASPRATTAPAPRAASSPPDTGRVAASAAGPPAPAASAPPDPPLDLADAGRSASLTSAPPPPPPLSDPAFISPAAAAHHGPDGGHLGVSAAPALDPSSVQVTTAAAAATAGLLASPGRAPAWWEGALGADRAAAGEDWAGFGGDAESAGGVAGPLYELVGTVFELDRRGFFRRQVLGVARQLLSLVAGGAIDDWLLGRLAAAREPGTLAGGIRRLRGLLWPGGVWITRAMAASAAGLPPGHPPPPPPPGPPRALTVATFLDPAASAPPDAAATADALRSRLLSDPPAWARLIGRGAYTAGVSDLLDMAGSPTFALSLGYGALRLVLAAVFPRLKPLLSDVERGGGGGGAGLSGGISGGLSVPPPPPPKPAAAAAAANGAPPPPPPPPAR